MKKYRKSQPWALLFASFVLAFVLLAGCSNAESWLVENEEINRNISFTIDMDVIPGYKDTSRYLVGLHNRNDAYHPKSVLISGLLLAPAGTEILNASVDAGGRRFPAAEVCRFASSNIPESELKDMEVEVDINRAAFAFLVDLSEADLQNGYMVRMEVSGVSLTFSDYIITVDDACLPYPDTLHALEGYIVKAGDSGDSVLLLQRNLAANDYLNEDQITGIYDEATRQAVIEFCKVNQFSDSETEKCSQGVTPAVFAHASSSQAFAKPKPGLKAVLDVLQQEIFSFNGFSVELWMIVAAGALLITVVLVLLLVLTGKSKKNRYSGIDYSPSVLENNYGSENIVEIDEPTINLENGREDDHGSGELDGATIELKVYSLTFRLFYDGMYADQTVLLKEGETALIGRSSEAKIQTNPADKSVSSKHGIFTVKNGIVVYTDQSTNGTKVGESMYLGKNKDAQTFNLPFGTRVTMEIGSHKVWVLVNP